MSDILAGLLGKQLIEPPKLDIGAKFIAGTVTAIDTATKTCTVQFATGDPAEGDEETDPIDEIPYQIKPSVGQVVNVVQQGSVRFVLGEYGISPATEAEDTGVAPPQVTSVVATAGFRTVHVEWETDDQPEAVHYGDGYYEVQLATASDFSTGLQVQLVAHPPTAFEGIPTGTQVWVRVRSHDHYGRDGAWSTTHSVTTLSIQTADYQALSIVSAAIADATIDSAKIASLSASKITAGTIGAHTIELNGATSILESSNFVSGSAGWQVKGDGNAEFNDITVRGILETALSGRRIEIGTEDTNVINFWSAAGGELSPARIETEDQGGDAVLAMISQMFDIAQFRSMIALIAPSDLSNAWIYSTGDWVHEGDFMVDGASLSGGWQFLGSHRLVSPPGAADVLDVDFEDMDQLMVIIQCTDTGGTISGNLQMNGSTSASYASRSSSNGGADALGASVTAITLAPTAFAGPLWAIVFIDNSANTGNRRNVISTAVQENGSSPADAPTRREVVGKWASSAVTSLQLNNGGTGSYDVGSSMTVLGRNTF